MEITSEIVEGVFIKESKNRFLCLVKINNITEECYVPNSSRMENYLNLKSKTVLLTLNKDQKRRTKYTLLAVKYYGKFILLNLNLISSILQSGLITTLITPKLNYNHFKEQKIHGYKTDLLLINPYDNEDEILVEAKGIISTKKETIFPQIASERAINQLIIINNLLEKGIKVSYLLISMSPIVKKVIIKDNNYSVLLKECIKNGLNIKATSLILEHKTIKMHKQIKIEFA